MSKKKNKFDLTHLVQAGFLKDGQKLCFVSDPSKYCTVAKQPNGEYKVVVPTPPGVKAFPTTVHAFAQQLLGMDPPDHASKWFKSDEGTYKGKTLFEMWHSEDSEQDYTKRAG